MTATAIISILVAIASFTFVAIRVWIGFSKVRDAKNSSTITFVRGNKKIIISSKLGDEDKKKLAHF